MIFFFLKNKVLVFCLRRPLSLIAFTGIFHSGTFWGAIADDIEAVGTPTGFQGKNEYQ
jgi:hypothetical protein